MNYIGTLKHTKIYATKLEIPRRYYLILYKYFIVRKIGISCELVVCCLFLELIITPFYY